MSRYLNGTQLAAICRVDRKTIHNWAEKGHLVGFRTTPGGHRRFTYVEVLGYLERQGYPVPKSVRDGAARERAELGAGTAPAAAEG